MSLESDFNEYRGVWVFVEQTEGEIARVSLELLGKGRELADNLGVELSAFLIGESLGEIAKGLIFYGADAVFVADDPILRDYRTDIFADIISEQVIKEKPEILILGATAIGRDLAPRLAFRLNTGCTADCTGLEIDVENRLFVSTRPAFGGNVMATIICPDNRPQMSTVRAGVMALPEKNESRKGKIVALDLSLNRKDSKVEVIESTKGKSEVIDIQDADRIIAFGMGVEDEKTVGIVRELAELLDAQIGASRLAVEACWITHDFQVGQTGKTVRPELYVACGISGAIQHTAGMCGSKLIVAINSDPNAEIFNISDYGIVADVHEFIPCLIAELKRVRGKES